MSECLVDEQTMILRARVCVCMCVCVCLSVCVWGGGEGGGVKWGVSSQGICDIIICTDLFTLIMDFCLVYLFY